MQRKKIITILATVIILAIARCQQAPVLPEADKAKEIETRLWRAGASFYAAEEYESFRQAFRRARIHEWREASRLPLFRKIDKVREEYAQVINQGEILLRTVQNRKEEQKTALEFELKELESIVDRLRSVSAAINESIHIRQRLSRAEVAMVEAKRFIGEEKFPAAKKALATTKEAAFSARRIMFNLFDRYINDNYLKQWEKWVTETVALSRDKGNLAIIVDKLEKKLIVYSKGEKKVVYDVGLGRFGLSDKMHSGDQATPEGKYKIIKKNPHSRYHRALLLDFPNEEDRRRFQEMKKKGIIPPEVGIGGLIEIHGGGPDGLTYGCVAMEDEAIEELYKMVEPGTPVTIVGTTNRDSLILQWVRELLND